MRFNTLDSIFQKFHFKISPVQFSIIFCGNILGGSSHRLLPGAIILSFSIDEESNDPVVAAEKVYKYDGPGGILAFAVKGESVIFDGEEKWVLQDEVAHLLSQPGTGLPPELLLRQR